jgi:hypothetical protein
MTLYQGGPSGGTGGQNFFDQDPGDGVRITSIIYRAGSYLDAIQLGYSNGTSSPWHGGTGGNGPTTIDLEADEYITELSGNYGDYINQLTITTSIRPLVLGGSSPGPRSYSYQAPPSSEIIALVGATGSYVDALGVNIRVR